MQGGKGGCLANMWRYGSDIICRYLFKEIKVIFQKLNSFLEHRALGCVFQSFNKIIDFFRLNTCQIVADTHIESEIVCV